MQFGGTKIPQIGERSAWSSFSPHPRLILPQSGVCKVNTIRLNLIKYFNPKILHTNIFRLTARDNYPGFLLFEFQGLSS